MTKQRNASRRSRTSSEVDLRSKGNRKAKLTRQSLVAAEGEIAPAQVFDASRIAALRGRFQVSQPVFAAALNVSPDTVKKWEQGVRDPDGAATRLLELTESHPQWILDALNIPQRTPAPSSRVFKAARKKNSRTDKS